MSSGIIAIMIGVSTLLGALGLIALIWGVKTGQFDDQEKFLDGARFGVCVFALLLHHYCISELLCTIKPGAI